MVVQLWKKFPLHVQQSMYCQTVVVALLLTEIEVVSGNDDRITLDNGLLIMINRTRLQPEKM